MRLRVVAVAALGAMLGCTQEREAPARPPTYVDDVQALFEQHCNECHAGRVAEGGYRTDSYYDALGCTSEGAVAVLPADETAPLVAVLSDLRHEGRIDEAVRALILQWVEGGTPKFRGTVHAPGVMDPRVDGWHGSLAAEDGYGPLRDPDDPLSCGRCHEGAPAKPEGITSSAPGATHCASCHTEPGAALSCGTCHGDGGSRSYPPRDACYFEPPPAGGAHAAHVQSPAVRSEPYDCTACHPTPAADAVFEADHANGTVDVRFDEALAGEGGDYDARAMRCAVGCHARGGQLEEPTWAALGEGQALDCDSCHRSPPDGHYAGGCGGCHAEMGAEPDSLSPGPLHLDGQVDVGDGEQTCGSCHGADETGWPSDPVHVAHRTQSIAEPVQCAECHTVPGAVDAPGHLDGAVQVTFGGRAEYPGLTPRYDGDGGCVEVACHAAWLRDPAPPPVWEPVAAPDCRFCHGAPPPAPHTADDGCSSLLCHGGMVAEWPDGPRITETGRATHLDGQR